MTTQNKKKLGYKQFEKLLAQAHQKSEVLAQRFQELQAFFIGYVEFKKDDKKFNQWMNVRIEEELANAEKETDNEEV